MSRDDRTTGIGLARYAREYFDCALAADEKVGARQGYEISAPMPVMFLAAHSLELALKAYLRSSGWSVDQIVRLGHDLVRCWDEAANAGLTDLVDLSDEDKDLLSVISDLHRSTELRYIETGAKRLPVFGPLQVLCERILNTVCPHVGYR